jgi:hypothetical protein
MRARLLVTIGSTVLLAAVPLGVGPAAAGEGHGDRVEVLSGPSPFADGCPGRRLDEAAITGAEVEPTIAVDPSDRRRVVATWQQDIGTPAARSDLVARSSDGGRTWRTAIDEQLTTDVWFAGSADRGASWHQEHLTGPFDLRTAPNGRLGEYQGLVGLERGFVGVVTVTAPLAQDGPSDVVAVRVGTC